MSLHEINVTLEYGCNVTFCLINLLSFGATFLLYLYQYHIFLVIHCLRGWAFLFLVPFFSLFFGGFRQGLHVKKSSSRRSVSVFFHVQPTRRTALRNRPEKQLFLLQEMRMTTGRLILVVYLISFVYIFLSLVIWLIGKNGLSLHSLSETNSCKTMK